LNNTAAALTFTKKREKSRTQIVVISFVVINFALTSTLLKPNIYFRGSVVKEKG